jgi:hypothetical protein
MFHSLFFNPEFSNLFLEFSKPEYGFIIVKKFYSKFNTRVLFVSIKLKLENGRYYSKF